MDDSAEESLEEKAEDSLAAGESAKNDSNDMDPADDSRKINTEPVDIISDDNNEMEVNAEESATETSAAQLENNPIDVGGQTEEEEEAVADSSDSKPILLAADSARIVSSPAEYSAETSAIAVPRRRLRAYFQHTGGIYVVDADYSGADANSSADDDDNCDWSSAEQLLLSALPSSSNQNRLNSDYVNWYWDATNPVYLVYMKCKMDRRRNNSGADSSASICKLDSIIAFKLCRSLSSSSAEDSAKAEETKDDDDDDSANSSIYLCLICNENKDSSNAILFASVAESARHAADLHSIEVADVVAKKFGHDRKRISLALLPVKAMTTAKKYEDGKDGYIADGAAKQLCEIAYLEPVNPDDVIANGRGAAESPENSADTMPIITVAAAAIDVAPPLSVVSNAFNAAATLMMASKQSFSNFIQNSILPVPMAASPSTSSSFEYSQLAAHSQLAAQSQLVAVQQPQPQQQPTSRCNLHPEGKGVECPKCDLILGSSRSLGGHITMMHSRNSCKTLKCPKCNWHYKYQETLEIHMNEKHNDAPTSCVYCASNAPHPRLGRGEQWSCGYKPYRCDVCKYSTTTKGNLAIHMQSDKHLNNVQEIQQGKVCATVDPISNLSGSAASSSTMSAILLAQSGSMSSTPLVNLQQATSSSRSESTIAVSGSSTLLTFDLSTSNNFNASTSSGSLHKVNSIGGGTPLNLNDATGGNSSNNSNSNTTSHAVTPTTTGYNNAGGYSSNKSVSASAMTHSHPLAVPHHQHHKPKSTWRCDVCNYETNVARNLRIHMTSEKHTQNMQNMQQQHHHQPHNHHGSLKAQTFPQFNNNDPSTSSSTAFNPLSFYPMVSPTSSASNATSSTNQMLASSGLVAAAAASASAMDDAASGLALSMQLYLLESGTQSGKMFQCCVCMTFLCDFLPDLINHSQNVDRSRPNESDVSLFGGNYMCNLCSYKTHLKANFQLHTKTDKHLQRLQLVNHVREGGVRNELRMKYLNPNNPVQLRCIACNEYANSLHKLQLHLATNRHKSFAASYEKICSPHTASALRKSSNRGLYCTLCDYANPDKQFMLAHLHSERHSDMLNQILPVIEAATAISNDNAVAADKTTTNPSLNWIEIRDNVGAGGGGDRCLSANEDNVDSDYEIDADVTDDEDDATAADAIIDGGCGKRRQRQRENYFNADDGITGYGGGGSEKMMTDDVDVRKIASGQAECSNSATSGNEKSSTNKNADSSTSAFTNANEFAAAHFACPLCQTSCGSDRELLEQHLSQMHKVPSDGVQRLLNLLPSTSLLTTAAAATVSSSSQATSLPRAPRSVSPQSTKNISSGEGKDEDHGGASLLTSSAETTNNSIQCWSSGCNERFASLPALQKHYRRVHSTTAASTFAHSQKFSGSQQDIVVGSTAIATCQQQQQLENCDKCMKSFRSHGALLKHAERSHSSHATTAPATAAAAEDQMITGASSSKFSNGLESLVNNRSSSTNKTLTTMLTMTTEQIEEAMNSAAMAGKCYNDADRLFKCDKCRMAFTKQVYLSVHNRTLQHRQCSSSYTGGASASNQSNRFSSTSNSSSAGGTAGGTNNAAVGTVEKYNDPGRPFKCDVCKESFTQKNILLVHYNSVSHLNKLKKCAINSNSTSGSSSNNNDSSFHSTINNTISTAGTIISNSSTSNNNKTGAVINNMQINGSRGGSTGSAGGLKMENSLTTTTIDIPSSTSSHQQDGKHYKCNLCKVAYASGTTLDVHLRSMAHQSRANKVCELYLSGELDPQIPLIEQPDSTNTNTSASFNTTNLASHQKSSFIHDILQRTGFGGSSAAVTTSGPHSALLNSTNSASIVNHLMMSSSSNTFHASKDNVNQSSSSSMISSNENDILDDSSRGSMPCLMNKMVTATTKGGGVLKKLLENYGFEVVMQFNEGHHRKRPKSTSDINEEVSNNIDKSNSDPESKKFKSSNDHAAVLKQASALKMNQEKAKRNENVDLPELTKCKCNCCNKEFSSVWVLKAHVEQVHRELVPVGEVEKVSETFKHVFDANKKSSSFLMDHSESIPSSPPVIVTAAATPLPPDDQRLKNKQVTTTTPVVATPTSSTMSLTNMLQSSSLAQQNAAAAATNLAAAAAAAMSMGLGGQYPAFLGMPFAPFGMPNPFLPQVVMPNVFDALNFSQAAAAAVPPHSSSFVSTAAASLVPPSPVATTISAAAANVQQTSAAMYSAQQQQQPKRARTRITEDQLNVLRMYFDINNSPTEQQVEEMSIKANLPQKVIKHWFRNTLFKERQRSKDSPYNFSIPPSMGIDLEEYEKTGEAKIIAIDGDRAALPSVATAVQEKPFKTVVEPFEDLKPKIVEPAENDDDDDEKLAAIIKPAAEPVVSVKEEMKPDDDIDEPESAAINLPCIKQEVTDDDDLMMYDDEYENSTDAAVVAAMSAGSAEMSAAELAADSATAAAAMSSAAALANFSSLNNAHETLRQLAAAAAAAAANFSSMHLNFNRMSGTSGGGGGGGQISANSATVATSISPSTLLSHHPALNPMVGLTQSSAAELSPNSMSHVTGIGMTSSSIGGRRANRTRFTEWQVKILQDFFETNAYPKDDDLECLSGKLNLSPRVIVVWFQNMRQKARKIYENNPPESDDRFVRTPGLNYQCKKCKLVFQRYYELIKHQRSLCYKDDAKFDPDAGHSSSKMTILQQQPHHHQQFHKSQAGPPAKKSGSSSIGGTEAPLSGQSIFRCTECDAVFNTIHSLAEHLKSHVTNDAVNFQHQENDSYTMADRQKSNYSAEPGTSVVSPPSRTTPVSDIAVTPSSANNVMLDPNTQLFFKHLEMLSQAFSQQQQQQQLQNPVNFQATLKLGLQQQQQQTPFIQAQQQKMETRRHSVSSSIHNSTSTNFSGALPISPVPATSSSSSTTISSSFNKRCPFCGILFHSRPILEAHVISKHPSQFVSVLDHSQLMSQLPDAEEVPNIINNSQNSDSPVFNIASFKTTKETTKLLTTSNFSTNRQRLNSTDNQSASTLLEEAPLDLSRAIGGSKSTAPFSSLMIGSSSSMMIGAGPPKLIIDDSSLITCHNSNRAPSENNSTNEDNISFASFDDANDDWRSGDESTPPSPNQSHQFVQSSSSMSASASSSLVGGGSGRPHKRFRTKLTAQQIRIMKWFFHDFKTPTMCECETLGNEMNLHKRVVQVWFQNARAKERKSRLASGLPLNDETTNGTERKLATSSSSNKCSLCDVQYTGRLSMQDHSFSKMHIENVRRAVANDSASSPTMAGGADSDDCCGSAPLLESSAIVVGSSSSAAGKFSPSTSSSDFVKLSAFSTGKRNSSTRIDNYRSSSAENLMEKFDRLEHPPHSSIVTDSKNPLSTSKNSQHQHLAHSSTIVGTGIGAHSSATAKKSVASSSSTAATAMSQLIQQSQQIQQQESSSNTLSNSNLPLSAISAASMLPYVYANNPAAYYASMMMTPGFSGLANGNLFYDPNIHGTPINLLQIPPSVMQMIANGMQRGKDGSCRFTQDGKLAGDLLKNLDPNDRVWIGEKDLEVGWACRTCTTVFQAEQFFTNHQQLICQSKDRPFKLIQTHYECKLCNQYFGTQVEFMAHCDSVEHASKANSLHSS